LEEKDAQNRTKLQALWQLRQGRTIEEVAEMVGKHPCTIQAGVAWYPQGGIAEALRRRQGGHGGKQSRLSAEQMAALKAEASAGKVRCIQDGVQWAQEQHRVTYTYWGMRGVFDRLDLRKKVPRPRNPRASAEQQEAWRKGDSAPSWRK
jgi:transposase